MTNFELVSQNFKQIQDNACHLIETCDTQAQFSVNNWTKEIGSGVTRVMQTGKLIEKGAVNFSKVAGDFTPKMRKTLASKGKKFAATGVSSIFHPQNPYAPIIHMNIRYFETDTSHCWFGGGIDLTPHYIDINEAIKFHKELKKVCDAFGKDFYQTFKKNADNYFFLPHRNETRGVGGIFYDHLSPSKKINFKQLLSFSLTLGELFPKLYADMLKNKVDHEYSKTDLEWMDVRRSRYVEFNLLYDKGTKFGLESKGNTESILLSMPPNAKWKYNYEVMPNSKEERTMNLLKKGINWINYK